MRDIPVSEDVDIHTLAKGTPGLSGADIENIVNEAALLAARKNHEKVSMDDFEDAKDKVMMGAERKSLVISDSEKRSIAYHEAGHAMVRMKTPAADPVHKVTIIPRGRALGVTHFLPVDERHIYTRQWCLDQLTALLGGRAAEVLVLEEMTTGAGDDLQRATDLARRMVTKWGMSEHLGPLTWGDEQEPVFLGREIAQHRDYSEETARLIDKEVKEIITAAFERSISVLEENEDALHRLADALLEREILDREEIEILLAGGELPPEVVEGAAPDETIGPAPGAGDDASTPEVPAAARAQAEPPGRTEAAAVDGHEDRPRRDAPGRQEPVARAEDERPVPSDT
jgi:cell division protease FtsH